MIINKDYKFTRKPHQMMHFSMDELPQNQLELMGLTKKDILNMPPRTFNALMSGNRTSLIRFNKLKIPGLESSSLDAKISLERNQDGNVAIRFHPINQMPKNTFNLTKEEISRLKSDTNFVPKQLENGKEYLISMDKQTNEFIAILKDSIEAPKKINGIELTEVQVQDFKEGKEIIVGGKKFRLDPNDELGVSGVGRDSILSSLEFKHSKYDSSDLLLDLALLTTGAGSIFMIGHLADLLVLTTAASLKGKKDNHVSQLINENKPLRNALAKSSPAIAGKIKKGDFLTPQELKQMIENHLDRHVEIGAMNDLEFKPGYPTGVNAIITEENKTKTNTEKPEKKFPVKM